MGHQQSPRSLARNPEIARMTDATFPEHLDRIVVRSAAKGAVFLCALNDANWMCQATNKPKESTCVFVAFNTIFRRSRTQGANQETCIVDSWTTMVFIQSLR